MQRPPAGSFTGAAIVAAAVYRAGRDPDEQMAAILLALFPVVFIFDTRLGTLMLVAAIVALYRGHTKKHLKQIRTEDVPQQVGWKDPWGTGSSDANRA